MAHLQVVLSELRHNILNHKVHGIGKMNYAYKYQNTFDDPLAEEFRQILSLPPKFKATDITGCSLWLDSADASSKNIVNGKVLNWIDKTTGKDFAVQTADNAPVPGELINGRETVNFLDGISYLLYSGSITYRECFAVCKIENYGKIGQIIGSYSNGIHLGIDMRSFLGITGHISFDGNNTLGLTARFALNNDLYTENYYANTIYTDVQDITIAIDKPQSIACYWNNTATTINNYISALLTSADVADQNMAGDIGEIIVYDRFLTPEERATVRAYQNQKWGII